MWVKDSEEDLPHEIVLQVGLESQLGPDTLKGRNVFLSSGASQAAHDRFPQPEQRDAPGDALEFPGNTRVQEDEK